MKIREGVADEIADRRTESFAPRLRSLQVLCERRAVFDDPIFDGVQADVGARLVIHIFLSRTTRALGGRTAHAYTP